MTQFQPEEPGGLGDILRGFDATQSYNTDPTQLQAHQEAGEMGVGEMVTGYAAETVKETGQQLGDAMLFAARGIGALGTEAEAWLGKKYMESQGVNLPEGVAHQLARANPLRRGYESVMGSLTGLDFAPPLEQLGAERSQAEAERPANPFDQMGLYMTPRDIGSMGSSVILGLGTVLSGGILAPVTVPTMGALAFEEVIGTYAEHLHENDDEFNPAIAGALLALVALETYGSKGALIDLPMYMAKRGGQQTFKEILKAGSKEARRAAIKRFVKVSAMEGGALVAEGGEELAEEALEGLAQIMYQPEFAHLREAIMSGEMTSKEWKEIWEISSEGGWKPFILGAGGGGVVRTGAGIKTMPIRRAARKEAKQKEMVEKEEIADAVVAESVGTRSPEVTVAEEVVVEEVAPEDVVVTEEGAEATVSDLDSDEWADRALQASSQAVEDLLLTSKTKKVRAQPPGKDNPVWTGIIPAGVSHNRNDRKRIFDRLLAARQRAAAVESGTEVDVTAEAEVPVAPVTPEAAPMEQTEEQYEDSLLAEQRRLEALLDETDPQDETYQAVAEELGTVEGELASRDIEFSRTLSGREAGRLDAAELREEPGTQKGTAPGGFATDTRTGERKYIKRYRTKRQAQDEVVANRFYDAAGVEVPHTELLIENGEVVGVVSGVVEGLTPGAAPNTGDGLVIDAWLGNWDVVGADGTNLTVGPRGEAVRLDQGGALRSRAQGQPKGDQFGDTVGEIDTLRERNPELASASPAQLQRGLVALAGISTKDIKRIVKENSTGDTAADNKLIRTLIKRRDDLLSRRSEIVDDSALEAKQRETELAVAVINAEEGSDYTALTEEEVEGLTAGERQVAENARKRLGREVVFIAAKSGQVAHNGWVMPNDRNTIYIVVARDARESAAVVAKRRGISERYALEAYESSLVQTLIHENVHLLDDTSSEGIRIRSASDKVLTHLVATNRRHHRIMRIGKMPEEQLAREERAESLSDMYALSQSGIDVLFLDRGLVRNMVGRLRMLASRLGGPKDVRVISRVIQNMQRGDGFIPADPSVVIPSAAPELSRVTKDAFAVYELYRQGDDKSIKDARSALTAVVDRDERWGPLAQELLDSMDEESLSTQVRFATGVVRSGRSHFAESPSRRQQMEADKFGEQGRINLFQQDEAWVWIHEAIHGASVRKIHSAAKNAGLPYSRTAISRMQGSDYLQWLTSIRDADSTNIHLKDLIGSYMDAIHAVTRRQLKAASPSTKLITDKVVASVVNKSIPWGKADKVVDAGLPYGTGNIYEFLSESITSVKFQEFLSELPHSGRKNIFVRVMDALKGILGISKDSEASGLLDEVVSDVEGVVRGRIGVEFSRALPAIAFRDGSAAEIQKAHARSGRGTFLTPIDIEDITKKIASGEAIVRVSEDGDSGYALVRNEDPAAGWDIQGVFNVGDKKGAGAAAVVDAIENGGRTLDAFDGFLPDYYDAFGFVETHRMKFNDEFAPEGWNFEIDRRPEVVLMTFTGDSANAQEVATQFVNNFGNKDRTRGPEAEVSEEWPSVSSRIEGKTVPEVRPRRGSQDPEAGTQAARDTDVEGAESSQVLPATMRRDLGPVPYADIAMAKANPSPRNLLVLLVNNKAIKGVATDEKIRGALKTLRLGRVKKSTVDYIRSRYADMNSLVYPPRKDVSVAQQRGEEMPFGPAGMVERRLDGLFEENPSPTAEQLSKMPGAPKPRSGVSVVPMAVTEKRPWSQRRQDTFVKNVRDTVEVAEGTVVETKNPDKIEALLKKKNVVIYVGDGGPVVHANQSWTDRFAQPVDYAEILEMTVEAVDSDFHNWYRKFGLFFFNLGGEQMVNEAAFVFGVTSAQNAVESNLSDTLHLMRLVREHRRDGKPWTKAALLKTMLGDTRRTKHTADQTARMFAGEAQIKRVIDFYVDGVVAESGGPKVLFYSASIVAGATNDFNPFSVQDRHQAAMYGFFEGSFNSSNGKFSYDKVIKTQLGYRYASHLTGRLSMDPRIAPLTPGQVQAAQWFFTKAGRGPYSDQLEAKEDRGLLANFGRANTDIRTGTIESAVRFNEFEIADFEAIMESLPEDQRFPGADRTIPPFTKMQGPSLDYAGGQPVAKQLARVMREEAPRVAMRVYPGIDIIGLSQPSEPLPTAALNGLTSDLIGSVTESNGTIRIFNEMGMPHTPLISLEGMANGLPGRAFAMTPLVGSITNAAHARVMGSVIGMGLMQPRIATIRQTPDAPSVTLRLRRKDGKAFDDGDIFAMAPFTVGFEEKGEGEVWQMTSPDKGFADITINPTGNRVSDEAAATKFKNIKKGIKDATGSAIIGDILRTEVEVTDQGDYQGVIEGSGLGIRPEGQSSVLGRVLSEVTAPALGVLRTYGFGFNRDAFQSALGVTEDVVQDLPAEFSRVLPAMALAEASALRKDTAGLSKFKMGESPLSEIEAAEVKWWTGLTTGQRWSVGFWISANLEWNKVYIGGDVAQPEGTKFPLEMEYLREVQSREHAGGHKYLRAAALAEFGSWDWSLTHDISLLVGGFLGKEIDARFVELPTEQQDKIRDVRVEIIRSLDAGITKAEAHFESLGMKRLPDAERRTIAEILTEATKGAGSLGYIANAVAEQYAPDGILPDDIAEVARLRLAQRGTVLAMLQAEIDKANHPGNTVYDYLANVYNEFVTAVAKAPVYTGDVYRAARKVNPDNFKMIFPVGSRFRIAAPASASMRSKDADFFSGKQFANRGESFFVVKSKTARLLNMETTAFGGKREMSEERGINMAMEDIESRMAELTSNLGDTRDIEEVNAELNALTAARAEFDEGTRNEIIDAQEMFRRLQDMGEPQLANDWIMQEHGAWDNYPLRLESETILLPGAVYEVTSLAAEDQETVGWRLGTDIQTSGAPRFEIKEVDVTEEEAEATPVLPEFSRALPPPANPVQSMTTPTSKTIRWQTGLKGRFLNMRTYMQDRFIRLDYLQRDIEEAYGPLALDVDPLNRFRNMPGLIAHKAGRFGNRVLKPLLKGITKAGISVSEFGEYAGAVHALEVNADMRANNPAATSGTVDSGLSDADAQAIIDRMKAKPNFAQIDKLRMQLVMIGRQNLSLMLKNGLMTQDEHDRLLNLYPNYIPLWNTFDPDTSEMLEEGGEQFSIPVHLLTQRTGREANSLKDDERFWHDRVTAMADQRYRVIRKSEQNKALQRLLRLSDDVVDDENLFERVAPTMVYDSKGKLVPDRKWLDDPQIIRIMVEGAPHYLKIKNTTLAKAIKDRRVQQGPLMKAIIGTLSTYTRYKRFYATQFGNPEFTVGNPVRDIQTAGATVVGDHRDLTKMTSGQRRKISMVDRVRIISHASIGLAHSWAAMWGVAGPKTKRQLSRYLASGARQGFFESQGPTENRRAADLIISKATPISLATKGQLAGKAVRAVTMPFKSFVDLWQHVNTMFDDGVRFSTYRGLVSRGVESEKAVEITRDLTVDFARMGTGGRSINAMYAFANASTQGSVKTLRLLKSPAGASVFGAFFSTGVMTELMNSNDRDCDGNLKNDWEEIPDWERDGHIMVAYPGDCDEDGETTYVKIPVAYGLAIPYVAGRRFVRWLKDQDTMSESILATMTATYSNLNPLGGERIVTESPSGFAVSAGRLLAPDMIDPALSLMGNQDWLGRPIYYEPFPTEKSPVRSQLGRDSTAQWAKDLAEFINTTTGGDDVRAGAIDFQPELLPFMMGDFFSGAWRTSERMGKYLQQRWIESEFPGENLGKELRWEQDTPGLSRFFTRTGGDARDFYEYRDTAGRAKEDIKEYDETDRPEKADVLYEEARAEMSAEGFYKEVSEYRKERKEALQYLAKENASKGEILREKKYWDDLIKEAQKEAVITVREEEQSGG